MIDAFAHIVPPRHLARIEGLLEHWQPSERVKLYRSWLREDEVLGDLDARWRLLDQFPGYQQVLVLGVFPMEELGDARRSTELAREVNDELAELVRAHPDQLAGFAAELPLNDVDASLEELDRAVGDLGALGFQLHTHVEGRPLDDPRFEPLFAKLHELDRTIWLHPARSPIWPDYLTEQESRFGIWWSLGWPYETATAMARLVYSGHMERYPGIKILTHHGGGMIPHFSGRLDAVQTDDQQEVFDTVFRRPPLDYFRMFYADTAFFGAPHGLRSSVEFFGADHILFGSDMPLGGPQVIPDTVADIRAVGLSPDDEAKVLRGNAERVLGLRARAAT
jgi:predicted TIM-barrel fold metal-dependent hydrolase